MSTPSLRKAVEAAGGTVRDSADGIAVSFPDEYAAPEAPKVAAAEIEAAVERAAEFGTVVLPLWRELGAGWYVAPSHEDHPGFWYICQIDERTGQPVRCECAASHCCHHLGAAVAQWRERVGWNKNDEDVLGSWRETLERLQKTRPHEMQQEEW